MRPLFFLLGQAAGVVWGGWLAGGWGAAAGACVAAWLGLGWHTFSGARVLAWLRAADNNNPAQAPPHWCSSLWSEVVQRTRRLLHQSRQREQAADARLHDLFAALHAAPDGIILLDAQGGIEWCNQMAEAHFGIALARDARQAIVHLVRVPRFAAWLVGEDGANGAEAVPGIVLPGRAGTPAHPVRLCVRRYPYGDGRRLLLSRDVTALEQAEAMRRDFVANVSHEIRTPLTVLMGFIETLQTLALQENERAHYLERMAAQAQRMHRLVQDLLTLSRLEAARAPGTTDWVRVADLLQHCAGEARALSALLVQGRQRITFPAAETLRDAQIAGNAAELQSACANLVHNAVRYTPAGGCIDVTWETSSHGAACLRVRDSGCGIAPEDLPRITERFYRAERSRARPAGSSDHGSGTGLGLAIVKHVAQRHDAVLHIDSAPGRGSTFSVAFPAARVRRHHPA